LNHPTFFSERWQTERQKQVGGGNYTTRNPRMVMDEEQLKTARQIKKKLVPKRGNSQGQWGGSYIQGSRNMEYRMTLGNAKILGSRGTQNKATHEYTGEKTVPPGEKLSKGSGGEKVARLKRKMLARINSNFGGKRAGGGGRK